MLLLHLLNHVMQAAGGSLIPSWNQMGNAVSQAWGNISSAALSLGETLGQAPALLSQARCDPFSLDEFGSVVPFSHCPGSSFTAIGAAFGTQGIYAMASIRDQIFAQDGILLGLAPLIYIIAAMGGIVSLAMGAPPKMYLWFFAGPALYYFLLGDEVPAYGVRWRVANYDQPQDVVWRMAEPALHDSTFVKERGIEWVFELNALGLLTPSQKIIDNLKVPYFFARFDSFVSDFVQSLVGWTGISSPPAATGAPINNPIDTDRWYLMSNLKWQMLESITGARLRNPNLRDTFVTLLNSECGDALSQALDDRALVAASNSKGGGLPCTVFHPARSTYGGVVSEYNRAWSRDDYCTGDDPGADYVSATGDLDDKTIAMPEGLAAAWKFSPASFAGGGAASASSSSDMMCGAFPLFFSGGSAQLATQGLGRNCSDYASQVGAGVDNVPTRAVYSLYCSERIRCSDLLYLTVQGFRWEAGHILYQIYQSAPPGMDEKNILPTLFYGWDFGNTINDKILRGTIDDQVTTALNNFASNLILVHLFRNELAMAPNKIARSYLSSVQQIELDSRTALANTGAKTKYGEVYTWAMMVPYVQGLLLYILSMAYPIACILVVAPGWHKSLITWMTFWVWVKLWDAGFAIVMVLERSVWSILFGNSDAVRNATSMMYPMAHWGQITVKHCKEIAGLNIGGPIPHVFDSGGGNGGLLWDNTLRIFDRALVLASAMDLDIQNGYYIYIMAAMYFAVPALTGQLVLGAKAGMAGMFTNVIEKVSGDAGHGARGGFTSLMGKMGAANAATLNQEAMAKNFQQTGLALNAIKAANKGLDAGLEASQAGVINQNLGMRMQNAGRTLEMNNNANNVSQSAFDWEFAKWRRTFQIAQTSGNALNSHAMLRGRAAPGGAVPGGAGGDAAAGLTQTPGGRGLNHMFRYGGNYLGSSAMAWMQFLEPEQAEFRSRKELLAWTQARDTTDLQAESTAQQAEFGIQQAQRNTKQSGMGLAERRFGAEGEFRAQSAAWTARRDYAMQATNYFAAMGVDTGFLSPGNKPVDSMGLARVGMLGSETKAEADYTNQGTDSYWAKQGAVFQGLQQNRGYQWVLSSYSPFSPGEMQKLAKSKAFTVPTSVDFGVTSFSFGMENDGNRSHWEQQNFDSLRGK